MAVLGTECVTCSMGDPAAPADHVYIGPVFDEAGVLIPIRAGLSILVVH